MALGYGQISFNDIYNELNAYGGYTSSRSARAMASHAGFGTPDYASDFHGYTTPAPETITGYTFGYSAYDSTGGGDWTCADFFSIGRTSLNRYVYNTDVNAGLNGYFSLEDQYYGIYALTNGYIFQFMGYCGQFL